MPQNVNVDRQTQSFGPPLLRFLHRWLVTTVAVMVAANIIPGIEFTSWSSLLVASLTLGILNALLRPLLLLLSLPLVILSLGLFALIINALLLAFVGQLVSGFHVSSFWSAFFGALLISITTLALNTLTGGNDHQPPSSGQHHHPHDKPPPPGKGPVIDV